MAGLTIGILATVLLQPSSTTPSIVVTIVRANLITVIHTIPIVMGANIGTSVANSLVSHGHIVNLQESPLGFQGASTHSYSNLLRVVMLLPLEIITNALSGSGSMLLAISGGLADAILGSSAETFSSPMKFIVGPLSAKFIKINKDLIKGIAKGCLPCEGPDGETEGYCKDDSRKKDGEKVKQCVTAEKWEEIYLEGNIVKSGFAADMGDGPGSAVVLVISLVFLCLALYGIVRPLHYVVLSSGRMKAAADGEVKFVKYTKKILGFNPYLSIFFGVVMTICVPSSSIATYALVPWLHSRLSPLRTCFPSRSGRISGPLAPPSWPR